MWAACCNWFCVDTEPEEILQSGSAQDRSNPNFRASPPEVTCRACGTNLQTTNRKGPCMDCKHNFCGSCLTPLNDGLHICQLCQRIRSTFFTRDELLKLKVKDLRDYLSMRGIPTDLCREKEDLVQLVLSVRPMSYPDVTVPPFPSSQSNQWADIGSTQIYATQDISATNGNISLNPESAGQVQTEDPHDDETESIDSEEILVPGRRASLSDISNIDDIESLSVRQLKEILVRNFVNYKGCCEKWELMERVTRLYNDQKDLQQKALVVEEKGILGPAGDENLCKVCMDCPIDCVLLECGHMVTCTKCGKRMSECPICRQYVVRAVHVFRS